MFDVGPIGKEVAYGIFIFVFFCMAVRARYLGAHSLTGCVLRLAAIDAGAALFS